MAEPGKLRATTARPWVGLLLLLAIASHAKDVTGNDLALQGTVVDAATGLPIAGADVRHLSVEARYTTAEDEALPGWSASTDHEGHFSLADLPSRDVYLQVTAAGYAVSRGIRVPPDTSRLDIRLGQGATIEGALSLVSGGVATGEVRLAPADRPWTWTSHDVGPLGRFRFEHVTPGSYRLAVRSSSGIAEGRELRVAEGDHVTVELSLVQLGRVTGWISGLLEGESASIALHQDDEAQRYVRSSPRDFGNGRFELHGVEDGAYVVKALTGGRSLSTATEVVDGQGIADFTFAGRSQLSGRVLAGTRPIPRMHVRVVPLSVALPSAHRMTDEAGRFEFNGLGDGEYEIEVQLGPRGTSRSFAVTVFGETVFDARLGPYSISGRLAPNFRNHFVQTRPLSADGEPEIHRVPVDASGRYRFDGLEQGDYVVSHSSPYYTGAREVRLFAASVEGLDFEPTYDQGQAVPVLDAESQEPVESATCGINEGPWAGDTLHRTSQQNLRLPTNLMHTDMTCTSEGYEPVPVRWDGGPMSLELEPIGTG